MQIAPRRRLGRLSSTAIFGLAPAALLALFLVDVPRVTYAWDFHAFWHAASELDHGGNPYSPAGVNAVGQAFAAYVYPPLAAELVAPLGLMPFHAAAIIFISASAVALILTVWLLGVRDWRCYGAVFLWFPTLHGLRLGTLTPWLALMVALAIRFEGRPGRQRAALALAIGLKLFLWPLWIWHAGRRGAAALTLVVTATVGLTLSSWLFVGFDGLGDYPELLRRTSQQWVPDGYGIATALNNLGVSVAATTILLFPVALAASLAVAWLWRRGRLTDGEALGLFVLVALVFSPVTWPHYDVLLLVPVATLSRDFSIAWCIPLALWLTPTEESHGDWWRLALGMGVVVATIGAAALSARDNREVTSTYDRSRAAGSLFRSCCGAASCPTRRMAPP